MSELRLEYLAPAQVKPRKRKFRLHPRSQLELIARSLRERGCIQPVLIDSENRVVCGEAVVEAAAQVGLNSIPVVRAEHLSDDELRAYAIAANRLADLAGYDEELLGLELAEINELLGEPDLTSLGFDPAEIDRLLGLTQYEADAAAEDVPPLQPDNAICRPGDLWLLGKHRLLCGDALDAASYDRLMQGDLAQLVLSDLPYNLSAHDVAGRGRFRHREFVQAAGEMSPHEFTRFLTGAMRHMRANSRTHKSDSGL